MVLHSCGFSRSCCTSGNVFDAAHQRCVPDEGWQDQRRKGIADVEQEQKAVEIGTYYEQFISNQVASGRFASNADVLQAGLRLLEEAQLRFELQKKELSPNVAIPVSKADLSGRNVPNVARSVTDAMRALASTATAEEKTVPVIPTTKGLLRSCIAAE